MSDKQAATVWRWRLLITVVVVVDSFWIMIHALKELVNGT